MRKSNRETVFFFKNPGHTRNVRRILCRDGRTFLYATEPSKKASASLFSGSHHLPDAPPPPNDPPPPPDELELELEYELEDEPDDELYEPPPELEV